MSLTSYYAHIVLVSDFQVLATLCVCYNRLWALSFQATPLSVSLFLSVLNSIDTFWPLYLRLLFLVHLLVSYCGFALFLIAYPVLIMIFASPTASALAPPSSEC